MEPTFLNRNVNEGFSGGEKKRNEILQLAVLEVRSSPTGRGAGVRESAGELRGTLGHQENPPIPDSVKE